MTRPESSGLTIDLGERFTQWAQNGAKLGALSHSLLETLVGCSHRKTTFPLTPKRRAVARTYVACLDCGKEFPYDWEKMRMISGARPF